MARTITPIDAHVIMNALVNQATGTEGISVVDSSTFVSAGETVLNTGIENTLDALSIVIGRTIVAIRPYSAKMTLVQEEDYGLYSNRVRKISFYDKGAKPVGMFNTQLHTENLYNGVDNTAHGSETASSVGSMWEQDKPVAIEFNFGGSSVWDFEITMYLDQLKMAFTDENKFVRFWNGMMLSKQNEMERAKEAFNRMNVLNYIGGLYDLHKSGANTTSVINLTKAYNDKYGTTYTSAELRSTHFKSFLEFFVSTFKKHSNYLTEATANYHWNPTVTRDGVTYNKIIRQTAKENQRVFLFEDLFIDATANVLPEIFNPEYIDVGNYEKVTYWQSQNDRASVKITPAIPNTANPASQTTGNAVEIPYVVGLIFDRDAIVTCFQFEGADSTPIEARKRYVNTWYHNAKNAINDFTENAVLFIMEDAAG